MTTDSAGLPPNGYPHEPLDLWEAVISSSGLTMEVTRLASILILMVSATSGPLVPPMPTEAQRARKMSLLRRLQRLGNERCFSMRPAPACMPASQSKQLRYSVS